MRNAGATELLTSYTTGDGEPWPFYERFGFVTTGERDATGEVILALDLCASADITVRIGDGQRPECPPALLVAGR